MRRVFKYLLNAMDSDQQLDLPIGAEILSVQFQENDLCLWALIDDTVDTELKSIAIIGTGQPCWCYDWKYLGTVQREQYVWHIFIQ